MHTTARSRLLALLLIGSLTACGGGGGGGGDGPVGGGADSDGDGLSDSLETGGWDIVVDLQGYGLAADASLLTVRTVTSDPGLVDTDGDGLTDLEEYQRQTDPRQADTDGDLLLDLDEVVRWQTNPNTVDTDGDARGPQGNLVPDARLFDGNELAQFGTSPSLADTDGDNRTDHQEANDPAYDGRISDLPRADLLVEGELDVRLNVEYAESAGQEVQYGVTQGTSTTSSSATSLSQTHGFESSVSYSFDEEATFIPPGLSFSVGAEATFTTFDESTTSISKEKAQEASASYSQLTVDSLTMTETFSSGSIRMGMRVRNKGQSAFTLSGLGVSVLQYLPSGGPGGGLGGGTFKTLGTLTPALAQVTLGPGAQTGVLEVSSTSVDPDVIRGFLAHPASLVLRTANFDMQNAEGIDFDFLTENTYTRTALVEIDYGDGTVQSWRIATNVERAPDGSLAGARVGDVLTEILGLPQGDPLNGWAASPATSSDGSPVGEVLVAVAGRATESVAPGTPPNAFWIVGGSREGMFVPGVDFQDARLRAGDELRLLYTLDADRDGVYAREEVFYGTSDEDADSDGDGLLDRVEAKFGWLAGEGSGLPGYPRRVFSDPRQVDGDGDGLDDADEQAAGTDPTVVDTDEDGLLDGVDPFPLVPALRLHVRAGFGGDGSSWATAAGDLQTALAEARARNLDDADPANDVGEIWVAAGVYTPHPSDPSVSFEPPPSVALYGGFVGDELKRGARNADPLTNGTVLSGDLAGDDDGTLARLVDNASHVVVLSGQDIVVDGFEVRGGYARLGAGSGLQDGAGIRGSGAGAVLRNLNVNGNRAERLGGGAYLTGSAQGVRLEGCWILSNTAEGDVGLAGRGGGAFLSGDGALVDCLVQGNASSNRGGGIYLSGSGSDWSLERVTVTDNRSRSGGGVYLVQAGARLTDCDLSSNRAETTSYGSVQQGGGLYWEVVGTTTRLQMVNCRVWGNAARYGGGIFTYGDSGRLTLVNSTVAANAALDDQVTPRAGGLYHLGTAGSTHAIVVANSILWANTRLSGGMTLADEAAQLSEAGSVPALTAGTSCIQGLATFAGGGNLGANPLFEGLGQGNLRLGSSSPAVDAGQNLVDLDPAAPGIQLLPATDLDGNARIVDGDGVPGAVVDLGAYERQF